MSEPTAATKALVEAAHAETAVDVEIAAAAIRAAVAHAVRVTVPAGHVVATEGTIPSAHVITELRSIVRFLSKIDYPSEIDVFAVECWLDQFKDGES